MAKWRRVTLLDQILAEVLFSFGYSYRQIGVILSRGHHTVHIMLDLDYKIKARIANMRHEAKCGPRKLTKAQYKRYRLRSQFRRQAEQTGEVFEDLVASLGLD